MSPPSFLTSAMRWADAVRNTRAPRALAICTAAEPIPPDAAWDKNGLAMIQLRQMQESFVRCDVGFHYTARFYQIQGARDR